jgi:hypothetical protein
MPESIDFSRVEPLGDNCELGFVMRKHGYEGGSFFRWVAVQREGVKSLIESDFQFAFQFENLKAHPGNMVMDTPLGLLIIPKCILSRIMESLSLLMTKRHCGKNIPMN